MAEYEESPGEITEHIGAFAETLDAECDVLKKGGVMPPNVEQPWRYYSAPLEDEHKHEHSRAVTKAGRLTVHAEAYADRGDDLRAWQSLALAQCALLDHLSARGRKEARRLGNAKGGSQGSDGVRMKIICAAEDEASAFLQDFGGKIPRSLPRKVVDRLSSDSITVTEQQVLKRLKEEIKT